MKGGAHVTAARMIELCEIQPMLLAMPSDGLWGDGSGYLPHDGLELEGVPHVYEEFPGDHVWATGKNISTLRCAFSIRPSRVDPEESREPQMVTDKHRYCRRPPKSSDLFRLRNEGLDPREASE